MVNKILIFFGYVLFFVLALIYFAPKISTYYMLEKELKKSEVILSNETLNDKGFSLNIENVELYVKEISSAKIENINIKIFALYNSVSVENIVLSSVASNFIPLKIDALDITYSIFNPLNVVASGEGEFGTAKGSFNITEMSLNLKVKPSELMSKKYKNSMKQLTKNEDGSYNYAKTF